MRTPALFTKLVFNYHSTRLLSKLVSELFVDLYGHDPQNELVNADREELLCWIEQHYHFDVRSNCWLSRFESQAERQKRVRCTVTANGDGTGQRSGCCYA
jgi:hypothetical protein